jgi:hypothetical protein
MIECLLKDEADDFNVHVDVLERAIQPLLCYIGEQGRWAIDEGGDRFVYFSPESPGLQVSFDDTVDRELAEHVIEDLAGNLASLTGNTFHAVWLS